MMSFNVPSLVASVTHATPKSREKEARLSPGPGASSRARGRGGRGDAFAGRQLQGLDPREGELLVLPEAELEGLS